MSSQLMDMLQKRKDEAQVPDLEKRRDEWRTALSQLFGQLERWLSQFKDRGLLAVSRAERQFVDDALGYISLPAFVLLDPNRIPVVIEPGPSSVIGGRGRVEMHCGPNRLYVVRDMEGRWMLVGDKYPRDVHPELDDGSFQEALVWLLR